jgi:transcriptional regulator with XRE-family HTH domain
MNSEIAQLIATIKRQLRAQGLTYRKVARELNLSEASVKRLFATERFTVDRLAKVSQLLGFSLQELLQLAAASTPALSVLTFAQEARLVADEKLLLVAVCALNHWSAPEIVEEYQITARECLKRLIVLDRMGLIELLPGDRIRRRVRRDFDWLPTGPIRRYFESQGAADFLSGPFDQAEESMEFVHGMLSEDACAQLKVELRRARGVMAALHEESVRIPLSEKRGIGLLLAFRRWEPLGFRRLRRELGMTPRRS